MIAIARLTAADLAAIATQGAQLAERAGDDAATAARLAGGPAWTVRDAAGRIVACAGFEAVHGGHAVAWAELADGKGAGTMRALTRAVRDTLDGAPYARVTTMVRGDFAAGHRWARLLGFAAEGLHPGWGAAGECYASYGRVKGRTA